MARSKSGDRAQPVGALDAWLEKKAERERNRPVLEESLLGGRFLRYARHRMTGFSIARLLSIAVQVVELTLLAKLFNSRRLAVSLLVVNACQLGASFWWGALEVMRTRVRAALSKAEMQREASRWLGRASILAAVTLAVPVVFDAWHRRFGLLDFYALVCCFRLALDLITRTIYSAVYAIHRVFRPLVSILATDAVTLAIVWGLHGRLGAWVFPLGLGISAIVSRGLALTYTLRAFRALRLPLPRLGWRAAWRRPRQPFSVLVAGLSSATMRLGSIVVLVLLLRPGGVAGPRVLVAHVLSPVLLAAGTWPQVFYLDFKRLEGDAARILRARFERVLVPLSLLIGALLWLAALGAVACARLPVSTTAMLVLAPLFVVQAYLGGLQMRHFTAGRFAPLLGASALIAAMLPGAWQVGHAFHLGTGGGDVLLAASILAGAVVLHVWQDGRRDATHGFQRSLAAWIRALGSAGQPVQLGTAILPRAGKRQIEAVATWIAGQLGVRGAVVVKNRRLIWFTRGKPIARAGLIVAAGGLAEVAADAQAPDGRAALVAIAAWVTPPSHAAPAAFDSLRARFHATFPDGLDVDVAAGKLTLLDATSRQAVWQDALVDAEGGRSRGRSGFDVTAHRPDGAIRHLFLVPRTAAVDARRTWRESLEATNWGLDPAADSQAALAGTLARA